MANVFDDLLAVIPDNEGREAFRSLGAKYPDLPRELEKGYLRQSDYSRRQDELRAQVERSKQWDQWRDEYWVEDAYGDGHGALKRELEKDAKLADLQKKVLAGGTVDFDEFNSFLTKAVDAQGIATTPKVEALLAEKLTEKTAEVQAYLDNNIKGYAYTATKVPQLLLQHYKEYGEVLNPDELLEGAAKAKNWDLDAYYREITAEKRTARETEKRQKELEDVRADERRKVLMERNASPQGASPVDTEAPQMGHFQERLTRPAGEKGASQTSETAPLGTGQTAREYARIMEQKALESA